MVLIFGRFSLRYYGLCTADYGNPNNFIFNLIISVIIMSLYLALLLATKYGYIPLHFKVLCWPLVSLYIAYNSGYLIETDLESRGYQIVDLVITSSIEEAKGIYLQRVSIGQVVANNIDCD